MAADGDVHVPHLASIETASVIRGAVLGHQIPPSQGERALLDLTELACERHAHETFLGRIWELRENVTVYDAVYVALAEALGVPLITCDARLARAPLAGVTIEVVEPSSAIIRGAAHRADLD